MRKLLLLPLVLWACGGAKEAPKAEMSAMTPTALTAADVVGTYVGTTTTGPADSVVGTWTSMAMTNADGALIGKFVADATPGDTVPMVGTLSADSVSWLGGPYTDPKAAAGSPPMMWTAVGRANGNAWTGTVAWTMVGSDSVVQRGKWSATRTP